MRRKSKRVYRICILYIIYIYIYTQYIYEIYIYMVHESVGRRSCIESTFSGDN